jgi:hypothetical protein
VPRKNPSFKQRNRIISANANRCCVCKRDGVGLQLHHIDGNNSNTVDENLAVLCVEDHDKHHRPNEYQKARHTELSADELLSYKESWEHFVRDAQSDNPTVIAVINAFGDEQHIHAAKILFQWPDETIEYERVFHLLEGDFDYWTDEIISEVQSIGEKVKLTVINEPLPVAYCPCCGSGFSNTVKEAVVVKVTDPDWDKHSIMSIYINPKYPSLAISLGTPNKHLYSASLHLCKKRFLHFSSDYYDERIKIKKSPSTRAQATKIVAKEIENWAPAHVIIATGEHDNPEPISNLVLPRIWEQRASNKKMQRTQKMRR